MKGIFRALPPLEQLESRLCLSTFEYQALSDYLDVQSLIAELNAPSGSNAGNFGVSIVNLSDIDADGIPDFAIGADGTSGSAPVAGQVFLFSGRTRELIRTLSDGQTGFGRTLANLGDVNGDGAPDLAVGSPERAAGMSVTGAVLAYSGVDGSLLWEVDGDGPDGALGRALAAIRDLDNDGIGDLAVGGRVGTKGEVRVLSGATGALIWTAYAGDDNASFGTALARVDQYDDLGSNDRIQVSVAVGAPDEGGGAVRMLDLAGAKSDLATGTGRYGASLASMLKYSTLGLSQTFLIIAEPNYTYTTGGSVLHGRVQARALMFDGIAWPNIDSEVDTTPNTQFGTFVSALGDLDFAVGELDSSGMPVVRLYSMGVSPRYPQYYIDSLNGAGPSAYRGTSAAGLGDLTGNGFADIVVGTGAPAEKAQVIDTGMARIGPMFLVTGGTRDGRVMWYESYGVWPDTSLYLRHLYIGGVPYALSAIPGLLETDRIVDAGADGTFVVNTSNSGNGSPVIIRSRVRVTLAQAVSSVVGGTVSLDELVAVRVGADGRVLLNATNTSVREASSAWVLETDGTLRFLWNGAAADLNESGVIVGTRFLPGNGNEAVEFSGGTVSVVPGLGGAQAINGAGDVAGWAGTDQVVVVHNGVPTVLGHLNGLLGASTVSWFGITRLDDSGRVLGLVDYAGQGRHVLYFDSSAGLILADQHLVGASAGDPLTPFGMDASGKLVGASFAYAPVDDRSVLEARGYANQVVVSGSGGLQVVATNIYGEPVVFTRDSAGDWHGKDARTGFQVAPDQPGLVSWVDPVDGLTYVVFITDRYPSNTTAMLRDGAGTLGAPGIWGMNVHGQAWNPFVSGLVMFTSTNGLVHIAGRDAQGHLVMMSRNLVDMADADAWTYADLTADHLMFQGLNTPEWVGTPVAYVTPWNGQNIAGLDADGHVQVVWWAPGMTLWTVSDLSTIAAAPALVGGITAFTTAWGAVNIVGNVASGDLTAIWWAPALGGQWLASSLSEAAGSSITLRADTLTSYVQPWGALNVAGIDQNGGVTIFWWSFTSNQWTASTVTPDVSTVPFPSGPLSSGVLPDGAAHLGGVSALGDVIDLSWEPGGSWILEDLTQAAV